MQACVFLLLCLIAVDDDWPADAEIKELYGKQVERERPFWIDRAQESVDAIKLALRDRNGNLRQLRIDLDKSEKRLKALKLRTIDPVPVIGRRDTGRGGSVLDDWIDPSTIRIDVPIDGENFIVRWDSGREGIVRTWLARADTSKIKSNGHFSFGDSLWFVVGETSWQGERIPVMIPIKK